MHLTILTPVQTVFEGEVAMAKFPGTSGAFQVLKNHAPLISTLVAGNMVYHDQAGVHTLAITRGIVEVLHNQVVVLLERLPE